MTTESLDVMDDRNPMDDPSDPRGGAAPDDPHAGDDTHETLSSPDYAGSAGGRTDRHTCTKCDREIPPTDEYCSDCSRKAFAPDRAASRYGSRSLAPGATVTREWTLDRVVAATVDDEYEHTASIIGKVSLQERAEFAWTTASDTQLTLIRDFDGAV